jgi:hypothetical protein
MGQTAGFAAGSWIVRQAASVPTGDWLNVLRPRFLTKDLRNESLSNSLSRDNKNISSPGVDPCV